MTKEVKSRRHPGGHGPGGPGYRPGEKAKDFKGSFKRLLKYLKPHTAVFIIMVIFTIGSTVFNIIAPDIIGDLSTDLFAFAVSGVWDWSALGKFVLQLIVLYFASSLCLFVAQFVASKMSQMVVYTMRKDIKAKLDKLPLKYYDGTSYGEILSRITNDIETISATLQQNISQIVSSLCTMVGVLIMMFKNSWEMTLITLASVPIFAIIAFLIAKIAQKQFIRQQKYLGRINGHIEEMYAGHRIIKLFGREKQSIDKFEKENEKLCDANYKAQFISGVIMPAMNFVNNLLYVVIVVIGAVFVGNGRLEFGIISAFMMYSRQFSQPIVQVSNIASTIQSTVAAAERVFEILDEKEEEPETSEPVLAGGLAGSVQFAGVDFSYDPEKELIKDMNLDVPAGGSIAIVGPTGAGKTTLVNLLMRFYELDGGSICIDGTDIRKLRRKDLRSLYSMVLQDTWLFSGTIRENIAYGKPDATDEEIINAAKSAHVHHYITTLADGYDTVLSEDASNLSQGQKQLLTIARAILCDSKILILDEATSSVDTRTESYIQNAMTKMQVGKTSFVIAHRLSTIKNASLILVMNKGRVIEQGTHKQLLEAKGFYADLYNSQFVAKEQAN